MASGQVLRYADLMSHVDTLIGLVVNVNFIPDLTRVRRFGERPVGLA